MEGLNSKHCSKCGEGVMPMAAFCQACGDRLPSSISSAFIALEASIQPGDPAAPVQEFRKLRVMNWAIVALISVGAARMLFKSQSFTGVMIVAAFMAFLVGSFLLTAVVLSRETIFFVGIPVAAQRRKLKKVAVAYNVTLGVFGTLGLITGLVTGQVALLVSSLIYVIPPILNVRALRALVLPG